MVGPVKIAGLDETTVDLGGDPWNDWAPMPGREPALTTIDHAMRWADGQEREFAGHRLAGLDLAAFVLHRTFPGWQP